jgi:hypothetical protein
MPLLDCLMLYGPAMLLTAGVSALVCHHRFTRRNPILPDTIILAPVISAALYIGFFGWLGAGWRFFTPSFWLDDPPRGGLLNIALPLVLLVPACLLPAAIVVRYYQNRERRKKSHVP